MLEHLKLRNLGPALELDFDFGPRINVLTGDNGLGKTFVLDLAWWALTRTWADGRIMHPAPDQTGAATISYHVYGKGGPNTPVTCSYRREQLDWSLPPRRPPSPGLIIYARIDGGFSLWDPAQNYWHDRGEEGEGGAQIEEPSHVGSSLSVRPDRPDSFQFAKRELWEGLKNDSGAKICRGLLEDWVTWRLKGNGAYAMLCQVLAELSPGGQEPPLQPGESVRLPGRGTQEIPTLAMTYGNVPIDQASAGIRRILSLAYMIVWAWTEHGVAAELRGLDATKRIVLLWDEVEAHLHPRWQRTILPAVVNVLQSLLQEADGTELQVIATTHAPLVLASLEPIFDENQDRLFTLELNPEGRVILENIDWAKQGDAVEWLRSPAFDMKSGYSREAERALSAAQSYLAQQTDQLPADLQTREQIDAELKHVLAEDDPFWPRWLVRTGAVQ